MSYNPGHQGLQSPRFLRVKAWVDGHKGSDRVQWDELGRNQAAVTRGRDEEQ
ncbi:hypothetical protein GCM10023319_25970 [Nocardia iowensis]